MIKSITKKTLYTQLLSIIVLVNIIWLSACQPYVHVNVGESIPSEKSTERVIEKTEEYDYRDSTLFFDEIHASLSMRVTFNKRTTFKKGANGLVKDYKFQFRSRRDLPVKISNIAITASGKRIFLEPGTLYLPKNKPLIFALSATDSQFIQHQPQAIFLFEYEDNSNAVLIEEHKLVKFITD